MALLDEKNLAAEAAKRARFRVHHVGTKLNEAELHELEVLAAKRRDAGGADPWAVAVRDRTGPDRPSTECGDGGDHGVPAAVSHLLGPMAKGQAITPEVFDGIVDRLKGRRRVWLWTGSRTTKRGAEPRWPRTVRDEGGQKESAPGKLRGHGNG